MAETDLIPTRRDVLRTGTAVGIGLLAGCSGDASTGTPTSSATSTNTPTETDSGQSVTMEPVGEVEFEEPPERWVPFTGDYADIGVALGQADGLAGIGIRARYAAHLYEELPGVSVNKEELPQLYQDGVDKEIFYEVDADLHVIDPNFMINRLQWSEGDVEEVVDNVAPFLGNTSFTQVYDWHNYRYYSIYEAFEVLAETFQERARYEAFKTYHDEVVGEVQSRTPEASPDVAVLYPAGIPPESFFPYLVGEGTQSRHWRDLQVNDALAANGVTDAQAGGGRIDFETLLEIDPDVLAIRLQGDVSEEYFDQNIRSHLEDHDVASDLSAVQNDRVIYGGVTYQGPIIHLFQLERAAQGLYPDEFGDEQLFDRERIAEIVTDGE
ncbi:ABC transporter substrate-binding protein [Halobaculum sp. CBA1158]|uniref:ABC transporter substrate-binding protein n=1 Tax=Halobaculum sp. CBA1158 TaxID=2904243 RepID=UPI001F180A66|nr:ABC transporter substrate-binding protein [Halobaculum sp. CBA1158]UIO99381.1 ABC transporter substrate-binding protein [Halobaculum sp. CBA1158]